MSTKRISLACTTVAFAALGWVAACSSNNSNNGGSSSTNTASNTGSNSNTSTSGGNSTSSSSGSSTTASGSLLIDDMSNPTGQIKVAVGAGESPGYWFTTINDSGGSITPTPGATGGTWAFSTVTSPADASISNAACIHGATSPQQYSEAGMGFNFAIQKIDAAADSGIQAPAVEYDISAHKGIQFWAFGAADAGNQSVRVLFPDHTTDPRGGVCPADATDMNQCYDSWQDTIALTPGWQLVTIHYTPVMPGTSGDLTQLQFGFTEAAGFDDTRVYGVTFQVNGPQTADAGTGTPFDLCVADITFVDN